MQVFSVLTLLVLLSRRSIQILPRLPRVPFIQTTFRCFASHDIITYIQHLSKELEGLDLPVVKWIYIETHTGKGQLDIRFAFVDTVFQSYVESE
jgi:hypothetical protein